MENVYTNPKPRKKTLHPEWHEDFLVTVPSRVGANFQVEVFDWNQLEQSKSLGSAKISLEDVEPFVATERTLMLSSEKRNKGQLKISMLFQPGIIIKSRKNTSTFSAAGRTMTAIGSAPINAGRGVFHGVHNVFRRGKDSDDDLLDWGAQPEPKAVIPDNPGTHVSQPLGDGERLGVPAATSSIGHAIPLEHGTLKVLVVDAKDLTGGSDIKPYAIVRIGDKEHKTKHTGKTIAPEWNETFDFPVGPATSKLYVSIFDHKTLGLGKSKSLGEAEVDILQYVQSTSNSAADVSVEIKNGSGVLNLHLDYRPEPPPVGRKSSVSSPDHGAGGTLTSPSRFSLRGRGRPVQDKEE